MKNKGCWRECTLLNLRFSMQEGVKECYAQITLSNSDITHILNNCHSIFTLKDLRKEYGLSVTQAHKIIKYGLKKGKLRIIADNKKRKVYAVVNPKRIE